MSTAREQKLVDILFECVGTVTDPVFARGFKKMTHEQRMQWVARQLDLCGFKTEPCGSSWGVLK